MTFQLFATKHHEISGLDTSKQYLTIQIQAYQLHSQKIVNGGLYH